jgi:hypothetical protein
VITWWLGAAHAQVDPACADAAAGPAPDWYVDDRHQQDALLNLRALATTLSPLHAPVPDEPSHGSLAVELALVPPPSCDRRLVDDRTRTQSLGLPAVVPRPRGTYTFPALGRFRVFGGAAYLPPVTFGGVRTVLASGELGVAVEANGGQQAALRYHWTMMKAIGDLTGTAGPDDPRVPEFYSGSTLGVDAAFGWRIQGVVPYLSVGLTDASTFQYVGEASAVTNNGAPYLGPVASLGLQGTWRHLVAAGELYAAPGRFDPAEASLLTGRARIGVTF